MQCSSQSNLNAHMYHVQQLLPAFVKVIVEHCLVNWQYLYVKLISVEASKHTENVSYHERMNESPNDERLHPIHWNQLFRVCIVSWYDSVVEFHHPNYPNSNLLNHTCRGAKRKKILCNSMISILFIQI